MGSRWELMRRCSQTLLKVSLWLIPMEMMGSILLKLRLPWLPLRRKKAQEEAKVDVEDQKPFSSSRIRSSTNNQKMMLRMRSEPGLKDNSLTEELSLLRRPTTSLSRWELMRRCSQTLLKVSPWLIPMKMVSSISLKLRLLWLPLRRKKAQEEAKVDVEDQRLFSSSAN